jgi:hypothetical protein
MHKTDGGGTEISLLLCDPLIKNDLGLLVEHVLLYHCDVKFVIGCAGRGGGGGGG